MMRLLVRVDPVWLGRLSLDATHRMHRQIAHPASDPGIAQSQPRPDAGTAAEGGAAGPSGGAAPLQDARPGQHRPRLRHQRRLLASCQRLGFQDVVRVLRQRLGPPPCPASHPDQPPQPPGALLSFPSMLCKLPSVALPRQACFCCWCWLMYMN